LQLSALSVGCSPVEGMLLRRGANEMVGRRDMAAADPLLT
jgi:hypothetical protein